MKITKTFNKDKYESVVKAHLRTAAFREWQHRLNRGDKLPRGKFFKGKRAGKPFMMMDEAHFLSGSFALMNSQAKQAGFRIDMSQMQVSADQIITD